LSSELFEIEPLMIAGDLNITLNSDEVWGKGRSNDTLAHRIKNEMMR